MVLLNQSLFRSKCIPRGQGYSGQVHPPAWCLARAGLYFIGRFLQWTRGACLLHGVDDAAYLIVQMTSNLNAGRVLLGRLRQTGACDDVKVIDYCRPFQVTQVVTHR